MKGEEGLVGRKKGFSRSVRREGHGVSKRNTLHMHEDIIVKHCYTIIVNISEQGLLKGRDPNLSQQVHEKCLV